MITRVSSVIRPTGGDLIFDHPYNGGYSRFGADPWNGLIEQDHG
jgi:hypothetical protein